MPDPILLLALRRYCITTVGFLELNTSAPHGEIGGVYRPPGSVYQLQAYRLYLG